MSCGCNTTGGSYDNGVCRQDIPYPQVSHESVPSLIDNLVGALYGSFYNPTTQTGYITKSVVNGRIVWNIPCDPNNTAQIGTLPRNPGEGLLCYLIRCFNATIAVLPTPINVPNTAVSRDSSGNFAASVITANLSGTATSATNLAGGSAGTLPYQSAAGVTQQLAVGTTGQLLQTNGISAPTWVSPSGLSVASAVTSTTSTNLANGSAGTLPYQSAAGTTQQLSAGTSGYLLQTNGPAAPTWVNPNTLAVASAATATTATSATTATTTTNLASGSAGSLPYQSAAATTAFLAAGTNGKILGLSSGLPAWVTDHLGTATNDSAPAGYVGEYISVQTTGTSTTWPGSGNTINVASITLTPGDWKISSNVNFGMAGNSMAGLAVSGVSSSSATIGAQDTYTATYQTFTNQTLVFTNVNPTIRLSLAATTTYYLVAKLNYSGTGVPYATGTVSARRMR